MVVCAAAFAYSFLLTDPFARRTRNGELPDRLSEARLSVPLAYGPRPYVRRGPVEPKLDLQHATAALLEIERRNRGESVEALHAVGVAMAQARQWDGAVQVLRRALQRADAANTDATRKAALWNDLAVSQYELAKGDPVRLIEALDSIERAWRTAKTREIAWTRAVVLRRLGLRESERQAWSQSLTLEAPGSPWAREARANHEDASRGPAEAFTPAIRETLLQACAAGEVHRPSRIVASFPKESRILGEEELLHDWAKAQLQGSPDEADKLRALKSLANALQERSGESLLADTVAAIEEAAHDRARRSELARALLKYRAAKEAYDRAEFDVAEQKLKVAEKRLRALNSPVAILANVYRSAALYASSRPAEALSALAPDEPPSAASTRYHAARGLRHWIRGLANARAKRLPDAVRHYEEARAAFDIAGEVESVASTLYLRSDVLDSMHATNEAWADKIAAQHLFSTGRAKRPLVAMGIAQAALRDHYDYAADVLLAEMAADARRRGDAMWMVDISLVRAVTWSRIGHSSPDGDFDRVKANVIHFAGHQFGVAPGSLKADTNLVIGLAELERQAQDVESTAMRAVFVERAQSLLLLASELQIMRGHREAALWFSDRARQVAVRTFARPGADSVADINAEVGGRELVEAVPARITVIHQDLHENQLATWVIRDGRIQFTTTPVLGTTLAADIDQFRQDIRERRPEAVIEAQRLYGTLLGSVHEFIADSQMLVYSRSPALLGVPVNALHDGNSFLVERQPVAITSSISTFLSHVTPCACGTGNALIALPEPPPQAPYLPGARREAVLVATAYGERSTSLLGVGATPTAFLQMAPQFDVIHVGTHGHSDRRPLQNALDFGSTRIRAWEIMTLRLPRAPVVVLASCSTGDETAGTTIGLSSAFVAAGASAVVGSLWEVEDQSTARLMIAFHQHLSKGVRAAEALAFAQKSAIARKDDVGSWAAFQVQM